MKIVLFQRESSPAFQALAVGARAIDASVVWQRPSVWKAGEVVPDASVVVIHGLAGTGMAVRDLYRGLGVPVWIVDCPRLRAEPNAHGLFLDSLAWLPEKANGRPVVAPGVIEHRTREVVLVCGQKPGDMAHGMDWRQLLGWARTTVARLRESTDMPIVYRKHPLDESATDDLDVDELSDPATVPLRDDLARAAKVVVYNSTVGWDAIAAGVPVEFTADADLVSFAGAYNDREDGLARAASTQWTIDELSSGLAIRVAMLGEPFPSGLSLVDQPKRGRRTRAA